MCSYQQLPLWQQSHTLANEVFRATQGLATDDHFDLAARMRSAALAIPTHIATHYSCDGALFLQGLQRARDALLRLEHLVHIAQRLDYWPTPRARKTTRQLARIRRHLQAFFHSLAPQ